MKEGADTLLGEKELQEAIMAKFGGKVVYELNPDDEVPGGLRDMIVTWPGFADTDRANDPQLKAHIERGAYRGSGKWVRRNKQRVFIKDYHKYEFNEQLRCWRWKKN
jgi:uncharacterized heparinase superfamily protein